MALLAGISLLVAGTTCPPAGCLAGAAMLCWGSTLVLIERRPSLASVNLLAYSVPMLMMLTASLDLVQRSEIDLPLAIWLSELAIVFWLMQHATRSVLAAVDQ